MGYIIKKGTGGGGGDATAANQVLQLAQDATSANQVKNATNGFTYITEHFAAGTISGLSNNINTYLSTLNTDYFIVNVSTDWDNINLRHTALLMIGIKP